MIRSESATRTGSTTLKSKYLLVLLWLVIGYPCRVSPSSCSFINEKDSETSQEQCERRITTEDLEETMSDVPKFGYWDIRGLGQPIRFLLAYLGVNVDETRYPNAKSDHWFSVKETLGMPFPNLPYFLDGPTKVTESRAIMKYICRTRKPEMVGKTIQEKTDIDMVDNLMYDLYYVNLIPLCYEPTDDKKKEFIEQTLPLKLGYMDKFMDGKQWVTGNEISYVDFFSYEVIRALRVYHDSALDKFSNLKSFLGRVEALPEIKKYMESDKYLDKPILTGDAVVKICSVPVCKHISFLYELTTISPYLHFREEFIINRKKNYIEVLCLFNILGN